MAGISAPICVRFANVSHVSEPDILHVAPCHFSTNRAIHEAVTFGFARGVDKQRLLALVQPALGPTTFERSAFSADLFLDELIDSSLRLHVGGKVQQGFPPFFSELLLSPPRQTADISFRHEIFRELDGDPNRLRAVENAYQSIASFCEALCSGESFGARSAGVRRRIDILIGLRRALDELLRATGTCASGLSRLAEWVEELAEQDGYKHLTSLLDFEEGRTALNAKLQAGYDGTLRRFEVVSVSRTQHPKFPRSVWGRLVRRVTSLIKGYRFSEEDVMSQLLDQVFSALESEVAALLAVMLELEFYLRGLAFRAKAAQSGLATCLPKVMPARSQSGISLEQLFNPWLCAESATKVVPCDVLLAPGQSNVIVTGPNSGGKTRLLQSLGVVQLFTQLGLYVPARSARVELVDQMYLSLLEHADPHQKEGRLGVELLRIRQVFEHCGPGALILMDELCSGTNPSEGERIFEMVLELLGQLGPNVWISTHFLDFAHRLRENKKENVVFLQVQLDGSEHPTYQFVPGVAQTSLAKNTAARLGVTREELSTLIRRHRRLDQPASEEARPASSDLPE